VLIISAGFKEMDEEGTQSEPEQVTPELIDEWRIDPHVN
jgi:hypothetical protein